MSVTIPANLAAALVRAQTKARAVAKDGTNDHARYRYATAESVIDEGRVALASAGLALLQLDAELVERVLGRRAPSREGGGGDDLSAPVVVVRLRLELVHESGESISVCREWPAIEQRGRPLDKAVGGALTSALSYAIRDVLLLPRDDELAAMDRRDDGAPAPAPAAVQRATAPASAPPSPTGVDPAWQDLASDFRRRIDEAGSPKAIAEVVEQAKAARGLPQALLDHVVAHARAVYASRKPAAA